MRIIVTGGCGFIGSNISSRLKREYVNAEIIAFDNLQRNGSKINAHRLESEGINVVQGDVRNIDTLLSHQTIDFVIDCAAEPSALAGRKGHVMGPREVVDINLMGTVNCLELARRDNAALIFISTNRVYPLEPINDLPFTEQETRFDLDYKNILKSWVSEHGVSEEIPLQGTRTLYGATKLCSEMLIDEYADMYGVRSVINRCSNISGPWQFGSTLQGPFALWVARHLWGGPLAYIGFGGTGKQLRDVLHVDDLVDAVLLQISSIETHAGAKYQLGGGRDRSVSLLEFTTLCEAHTGNQLSIAAEPETRPGDLRWYLSDCRKFSQSSDWAPRRGLEQIVGDLASWLSSDEDALRPVFDS